MTARSLPSLKRNLRAISYAVGEDNSALEQRDPRDPEIRGLEPVDPVALLSIIAPKTPRHGEPHYYDINEKHGSHRAKRSTTQ